MIPEIKTIAKINGNKIVVIENGDIIVPIKPICDILGIDVESQRKKIKNDEILNSVAVLSTATGADGKSYDMYCIPYMFIFGWLFSINPNNVGTDAKESVIKYKLECYKALYNHFALQNKFLNENERSVISQKDRVKDIRREFNTAKQRLKEAEETMDNILATSFEEWQMKLQF
jgi:hypothetical protein